MSDKLKKALLGALVTVALAAAVSYGLISQQTADKIQAETNQTLSDGQSAPPSTSQQPGSPASAPQNTGAPAPQPPAPTARP